MVLKIALGVFLGITLFAIIAVCIWKGPQWIEESKESDAIAVMISMTPDLAITRCGKPDRDWLDRFSTGARFLQFSSASAGASVTLEFYPASGGGWFFGSFVSDEENGIFQEHPSKASQLKLLPCLAGK